MKRNIFLILSVILFLISCDNNQKSSDKIPIPEKKIEDFVPDINYSLVAKLPHDTLSFTEGFLFHDNLLFESTGSPEDLPQTKSIFGIVDLKNGKIIKKGELDKMYFGEGIVILSDKLYQLTYKNHVGFIYNAKNFKLLSRFNFENEEGWGLTTDGKSIIMSDGTNTLTYIDPSTLKPIKKITVSNDGYAEDYLNELEYINGFIYANIWTKNYIVKIDPKTGKVTGLLNLSSLVADAKKTNSKAEVLNGIAFDSISNKIYVTGKLWSNIYQIDFPH
jgi:glutaminyl-peptide cyclotransferase